MDGQVKRAGIINRKKRRLMRLLVFVAVFWGLAGGSGAPAFAYVLDGRHVIELMLDHMNLPGRLRVDQTLTLFDDQFEGGQIAVRQQVSYQVPARFRSEIQTESLHRISVETGNKSLTLVDGRIVSRSMDTILRYKDLFCYHSRQALVDRLAYLGMNVPLSSYGRWKKEPVYVLGAKYPDTSRSQLWVNKDTFLPVRWIFPGGPGREEPGKIEFQYEGWHHVNGGQYPRVIKLFRNERLIRKMEIHGIETGIEFPDNFFNLDYLAAGAMESGVAAEETVPENEIDQQIREFREIFQSGD